MPNPIGILRPGQTGKPSRHIRRDVAESLVLRKICFWIVMDKVAEMRDMWHFARAMREHLGLSKPVCEVFIPERIPAVEVSGTYFHHPPSRAWRRDHRVAFIALKTTQESEVSGMARQLSDWAKTHNSVVEA